MYRLFKASMVSVTLLIIAAVCFISCHSEQRQTPPAAETKQAPVNPAPVFNPDSAYAFVKAQCDFGPRVPNTKAHEACAAYLTARMKEWSPNVTVQTGKVTTYDGVTLNITNIIASFHPEKKNRILLFAHWDSRPWADQDTVKTREPIIGADDGGSGVAVLMEIARELSRHPNDAGIDLALFDAEDWGAKNSDASNEDSYALGTQYWAKNPHTPGYTATYGILLDMVGARNATFRIEGNSKQYASFVVEKVWKTANDLGYGSYFLYEDGGWVTDDHLYVNKINIPSIDIIHSHRGTISGFPPHWHTHGDNMDVIDPATLKAVGQTLLTMIYSPDAI